MKKIITSFFCGLSLWADAQTSGGGDPPAPGPDNNHNYAIPGGGAFVTPGKGFIAPGTGVKKRPVSEEVELVSEV